MPGVHWLVRFSLFWHALCCWQTPEWHDMHQGLNYTLALWPVTSATPHPISAQCAWTVRNSRSSRSHPRRWKFGRAGNSPWTAKRLCQSAHTARSVPTKRAAEKGKRQSAIMLDRLFRSCSQKSVSDAFFGSEYHWDCASTTGMVQHVSPPQTKSWRRSHQESLA